MQLRITAFRSNYSLQFVQTKFPKETHGVSEKGAGILPNRDVTAQHLCVIEQDERKWQRRRCLGHENFIGMNPDAQPYSGYYQYFSRGTVKS
jgi:hypothetical protein